jgi:tRNA A-37 threonylcarbamoyl transferase component Bud32
VRRLGRSRNVGFAVEGISRDALIRLIDHPELPLRIHTRDTIKAGRTAVLVRGEIPMGGRMVCVAYKEVKRRNAWKVLTAWLFGNRTLGTWKMGLKLKGLGIPTAGPLLVVVPRWHQPRRPSYLAMEWLPQSRNITAYSEWLEQLPSHQSRQRLHDAAEKLGELLGKMHSHRVSHRDLKAGNLLLINKPSSVEAYVIDLDGVRRHAWLPTSRRLRDLSRLVLAMESHEMLTHSARLRFLLSYMRAFGEAKGSWKSHWRQLARLSQRRRMRKHKRGSSKA